jgi:transposase
MHMLADTVELVIGVDTHKHTHTAAAVVATTGAVITQVTVPATPAGYQQLLKLASQQPGQRVSNQASGCGRSRAPAATAPA